MNLKAEIAATITEYHNQVVMGNNPQVSDYAGYLLKLFRETVLEIVGDDEREILVPAKPRQGLPTKDGIAMLRNKLRNELRTKITGATK